MILFGKEFALRRAHLCPACAAKDQTITLLADVVDWHRSQSTTAVQTAPLLSQVAPHGPVFPPKPAEWFTDEEEDIVGALESGAMDTETAEKAFAAIQARNTLIAVK